MILRDKKIILGITGGIAAYKAVEIASRLVKAGALVEVVMTESATRFVAPLSFQAITHRPVAMGMFELLGTERIAHVELGKWADLLIIAPATANTIAKMAQGIANNLLTAIALTNRGMTMTAPAMETGMWNHHATQTNVNILRERGVVIIGPAEGRLASGATGAGRMLEPWEIVDAACAVLGRDGVLIGRHVLVTAGATQEAVDPVRILTNRSSGKMGYALARAARDAGAVVTLVHAPTALTVPWNVCDIAVTSALELRDAVIANLAKIDILLMAAAVADYRPEQVSAEKIKKSSDDITLKLMRNPDILQEVSFHKARPRVVVGFAAESENVVSYARQKLEKKKLDMIVANDARRVMGADTNIVTLLYANGRSESWEEMTKDEVAERIIARVGNYAVLNR